MAVPQKVVSREVMPLLEDYAWEGNIRELENFVKYVLSTVDRSTVGPADIPDHFKKRGDRQRADSDGFRMSLEATPSDKEGALRSQESFFEGLMWEELEKAYVTHLLEKNKWNVTRAAKDANVNRSTFDSRMKRLGISKG